MLRLVLLLLAAGTLSGRAEAQGVTAAQVLHHREGIWSLDPANSLRRWIVIHKLADADENAVLHIEVLAQKEGAQPWQFQRLAAHMAVTMDALRTSIRKPLKRGAVYPEAFEYAFLAWTRQKANGQAPVCTTHIDRCLHGDW